MNPAPTSTCENTPSLSPNTCTKTTLIVSKPTVPTIDGPKIKVSSICAKCFETKATIYLEVKGFEFVDFIHYDIALFQTKFVFFSYSASLMITPMFIFVCNLVATMSFTMHASKGKQFVPHATLA
jgi:hypothetical protein